MPLALLLPEVVVGMGPHLEVMVEDMEEDMEEPALLQGLPLEDMVAGMEEVMVVLEQQLLPELELADMEVDTELLMAELEVVLLPVVLLEHNLKLKEVKPVTKDPFWLPNNKMLPINMEDTTVDFLLNNSKLNKLKVLTSMETKPNKDTLLETNLELLPEEMLPSTNIPNPNLDPPSLNPKILTKDMTTVWLPNKVQVSPKDKLNLPTLMLDKLPKVKSNKEPSKLMTKVNLVHQTKINKPCSLNNNKDNKDNSPMDKLMELLEELPLEVMPVTMVTHTENKQSALLLFLELIITADQKEFSTIFKLLNYFPTPYQSSSNHALMVILFSVFLSLLKRHT